MFTKDPSITAASVASILLNPANNDNLGLGNRQGAGRLNAQKALNATP
jgi:hypothetical protein